MFCLDCTAGAEYFALTSYSESLKCAENFPYDLHTYDILYTSKHATFSALGSIPGHFNPLNV